MTHALNAIISDIVDCCDHLSDVDVSHHVEVVTKAMPHVDVNDPAELFSIFESMAVMIKYALDESEQGNEEQEHNQAPADPEPDAHPPEQQVETTLEPHDEHAPRRIMENEQEWFIVVENEHIAAEYANQLYKKIDIDQMDQMITKPNNSGTWPTYDNINEAIEVAKIYQKPAVVFKVDKIDNNLSRVYQIEPQG